MFRLHLYGFIFTPKLIPTLGLIIVLPILIGLGLWQLDRADYKNQLQTKLTTRPHHAPLSITQLNHHSNDIEYYPVKITGKYDNKHQILIDNRILNHQAGYYVLTPFIPKSNPTHIILVNRGWIPRLRDRRELPPLKPVLKQQTITGIIKRPPSKTFVLPHKPQPVRWPLVLQAIDWKKMTKALKRPIYPFMILLSPKEAHGFVRKWTNVATQTHKHHGYAIQWFSLALTLVIIYLVTNISRGRYGEPKKEKS